MYSNFVDSFMEYIGTSILGNDAKKFAQLYMESYNEI